MIQIKSQLRHRVKHRRELGDRHWFGLAAVHSHGYGKGLIQLPQLVGTVFIEPRATSDRSTNAREQISMPRISPNRHPGLRRRDRSASAL